MEAEESLARRMCWSSFSRSWVTVSDEFTHRWHHSEGPLSVSSSSLHNKRELLATASLNRWTCHHVYSGADREPGSSAAWKVFPFVLQWIFVINKENWAHPECYYLKYHFWGINCCLWPMKWSIIEYDNNNNNISQFKIRQEIRQNFLKPFVQAPSGKSLIDCV